jgi:hypothetical protein
VRPDGNQPGQNHVSDSVSVDTDPASTALYTAIETVQQVDANGVTAFDELAGIAFASNQKAQRRSRRATDHDRRRQLRRDRTPPITAQDLRAIAVRDGCLYVTAFESGTSRCSVHVRQRHCSTSASTRSSTSRRIPTRRCSRTSSSIPTFPIATRLRHRHPTRPS